MKLFPLFSFCLSNSLLLRKDNLIHNSRERYFDIDDIYDMIALFRAGYSWGLNRRSQAM